jgi:hypothetical protein
MGYFKRAVISNGYFEGAVTSKIPTKIIGFIISQHDILLINGYTYIENDWLKDITIRSSLHYICREIIREEIN